jgi:hypothetical protein
MSTPTVSSTKRNRSAKNSATVSDAPIDLNAPATPSHWAPSWSSRAKLLAEAYALGKQNPSALAWSLPNSYWQQLAGPTLVDRTKLLKLFAPGTMNAKLVAQVQAELQAWLAQPSGDPRHAWEALLWQNGLLSWWNQWEVAAREALLARCEVILQEAAQSTPEPCPLSYQWLAVELPWMLAITCSELPQSAEWQRLAQRNFVRLCEACFNAQGLPHPTHLPHLSAIVASWTRCALAGQALSQTFLPKHEQPLFLAALRQTVRFSRANGTGCFSTSSESLAAWLPLAIAFVNDTETEFLAKQLFDIGKKQRKKDNSFQVGSAFSAEQQVGLLRSDVSAQSTQVALTFNTEAIQLELLRKTRLLAGDWSSQLSVNGQILEQTHEWEDVLWYEDEEAVYLELETRYADVWRVQRQIVIPRQDPIAFLADAVLGPETADLHYIQTLPLAEGLEFQPEQQTNEGWLTQGNNRWLMLPLACPEWRREHSAYALAPSANGLRYEGQRKGRCLYLPLFLMLNPSRGKLDYTWRRLTVAEQLEILSPDVASASRIQIGDLQWVSYRALSHKGNRTFLGQNLVNEFYFGRFHRDGTCTPIMVVE